MKRALIIIGIIVVLGVAGFFGFRRFQRMQASAASNYQTVRLGRGDLAASVGATGTVRSNQSAELTWQLSGKVNQVKAAVGDRVQSGQELANLQEQSLPQSVILARADLVTAKRDLDQLLNSDTARAKASQALVAAQKELDDARTKRESKNYARALPATVDEARANLVIAQDAVDNATKLYDKMNGRPQDDPVRAEAFAQLSKARKNYDTQLANLNWLLGRPDNQEVAEADARVLVAEAALKDAQREWDRLKDGPDPQDVAAAQAHIAAIQSTLDQINLESPFNGTITEVDNRSGDQTTPGMTAFRVDDLSRLLVDVQVTEVDINHIRTGLPAMMTFDAIPDKEFSGKVAEVARVGTPVQGVVNFKVTIELNNVDGTVRPGMTAAVNIVTDFVENTLLVENRAVRLRDGKHVVYVLRNGVPQVVTIELGLTSDTASQVASGDLKEGDLLVLNPPNQFNFAGGGPGGGR